MGGVTTHLKINHLPQTVFKNNSNQKSSYPKMYIIMFVFFVNRFEIFSLDIPKVEVEVTGLRLGFNIDRYVLHLNINKT